MEGRILAEIEPTLLIWARERLQATTEVVAKKTSISRESIEKFETGEKLPTFDQLRKISNFYRMNISVFFLSEPPRKHDSIKTSFRRLVGLTSSEFSIELRRELFSILAKREALVDIYREDLNEKLASFGMSADFTPGDARRSIGLDFEQQRRWRDGRVAFNQLRVLFEQAGILVVQVSGIAVAEMRACALNEDPLPIIVLNRADSYFGRIFSLAHELYHLLRRDDDVVLDDETPIGPPEHLKNEILANKFAAEFLIPHDILSHYLKGISAASNKLFLVERMSKDFCVSRESIARILLDIGVIVTAEYHAIRDEGIANSRKKTKGGPVLPHVDTISLLGRPFSRAVVESYRRNRMDRGHACDLLDIKIKWLPKLVESL